MPKQQFILDEIWMLTVNAAFQRANIYEAGTTEKDRQKFRDVLKKHISSLGEKYGSPVDELQHIQNINSICSLEHPYKHLLKNASLSFGVSQKLLNLYLKYLWALEIITFPPPHFPIDRIIQTKLKIKSPVPWTAKHFNEDAYMQIIETAKALLAKTTHKNLAELELGLFNRKSSEIRKVAHN